VSGWPAERKRSVALSLLAWAGTASEGSRWAAMLKELFPTGSDEKSIAAVVEALKFPFAAGPATDHLLDTLKKVDPRAPGKGETLQTNLAWIASSYPSINLDSPPACPVPPSPLLTCSSSRR
jgi:hypothetical protein